MIWKTFSSTSHKSALNKGYKLDKSFLFLSREIALSVAASVAFSASQNMVATSSEFLGCLAKSKSSDEDDGLDRAEECISKLRYDPFSNEI